VTGPLRELAAMDKLVDTLLDEPIGSVFERREAGDELYVVTDWKPVEKGESGFVTRQAALKALALAVPRRDEARALWQARSATPSR
jgi:hypothetical protein